MAWAAKARNTGTSYTPKAINPATFSPKQRLGTPIKERHLAIGGGFTLDIGSGYKLIIQPFNAGQTYTAKTRQPL